MSTSLTAARTPAQFQVGSLPLEQLELCLKGEAPAHHPVSGVLPLQLTSADWKEFRLAQKRGWIRWRGRSPTPLHLACLHYCELTQQPWTYIRLPRGARTPVLNIHPPEGWSLPPAAVERLTTLTRPHLRARWTSTIGSSLVQVPVRGLPLARELIGPMLDLVLEIMEPQQQQDN